MMRFTRPGTTIAVTSAAAAQVLRRLSALLAVTVAGVLMLSGCGVEVVTPPVVEPAAASTTIEVSEPSPTVSAEPAVIDVDPSAKPEPSASDDGDPTEKDLARRSYYDGQIDLTTGCPTGKVVIDQSMRVTKITEDCAEVVVIAPFTTLLAEHVGTLTIKDNASHGHFLIGSIGKATVTTPFNHVYWDSGKPVLNVTGFKCVVGPNPAKEK